MNKQQLLALFNDPDLADLAEQDQHDFDDPGEAAETDETAVSSESAALGFEEVKPGELMAALPREQQKALSAIFAGKSIAASARRAGVSRSTLYRWGEDPDFVAVLNAWRTQAKLSREDRVRALGDLAIDNVYAGLRKGDVKLSISILRLLAAQDKKRRFITSPQKLARLMESRKKVKSMPVAAPVPPPPVAPPPVQSPPPPAQAPAPAPSANPPAEHSVAPAVVPSVPAAASQSDLQKRDAIVGNILLGVIQSKNAEENAIATGPSSSAVSPATEQGSESLSGSA